MSGNNNKYQFNAPVTNVVDSVEGDVYQQISMPTYTAIEQRQNLQESAIEIQKLLQQLELTYPNATEAEKQSFVTSKISLVHKKRLVRALQAGGEKALEEFFKNPYISIAIATIKEWQKP